MDTVHFDDYKLEFSPGIFDAFGNLILSVESQKGIITIQWRSIENQKGAIAVYTKSMSIAVSGSRPEVLRTRPGTIF